MVEHYLTAMTMTEGASANRRSLVLMGCRCGVVIKCDYGQVGHAWVGHFEEVGHGQGQDQQG